jgi:hypothetical protein
MATRQRRQYSAKSASSDAPKRDRVEPTLNARAAVVVNRAAAARSGRAFYNVTALGAATVLAVNHSPITYVLQGEIKPGWTIVRPMLLTVERDEYGDFVYSDDRFNVYGEGPTQSSALADYVVSLVEYYDLLAAGAGADPCTGSVFSYLSQYLRRVSA